MRIFVAIELDEALREAAEAFIHDLRASLGPEARRVKWVAPANLHFTLKFLGEVPAIRLEAVRRGVRAVAGAGCFILRLGSLRAFPSVVHPRVLWLDVADGAGSLASLAARVDAELQAEGFLPEVRAFASHVTIGRVREGARLRRLPEAFAHVQAANFPRLHVQMIRLMESTLGHSGPSYEALEVVSLDRRALAESPGNHIQDNREANA